MLCVLLFFVFFCDRAARSQPGFCVAPRVSVFASEQPEQSLAKSPASDRPQNTHSYLCTVVVYQSVPKHKAVSGTMRHVFDVPTLPDVCVVCVCVVYFVCSVRLPACVLCVVDLALAQRHNVARCQEKAQQGKQTEIYSVGLYTGWQPQSHDLLYKHKKNGTQVTCYLYLLYYDRTIQLHSLRPKTLPASAL